MKNLSESVTMSPFAQGIFENKYAHTKADGTKESWTDVAKRLRLILKTANAPKFLIDQSEQFIAERKFIPGGRYLYATGRPFHQVNNCILLRAEDSREGWADLEQKSTMALMTGAGIGTDYSRLRERGAPIRKTGGTASGPTALMQMINETGRHVMQGGSRRSAIWAGLNWAHPDILEFLNLKNWSEDIRTMKGKDFNFPAPMDMTNISILLDDEFFAAYGDTKHVKHSLAHNIYWQAVRNMLETGEPGFSIDTGKNSGETLRNACTEVCSRDDSDVCNLGSINMARIDSLEEMQAVTEVATAFLLAGTMYSDVPYDKIAEVRAKNRRLGLGLMGLHDWLMLRGHRYEQNEELDKYLEIYATSGKYARTWANEWDISTPIKTRAIAPTGTIGIVAETTTGIEPMFAAAYKRRYLKGTTWHYEYVIDPTAKKAVEKYGIRPSDLEDAYSLADDPERRMAFQAHVQKYVDHGISSTLNLPKWGTEANNEGKVQEFGAMLIKYLPNIRGCTVYPDGGRGGQPLNVVHYSTAIKHVGNVFIESSDVCDITKAGSCGS